MLMNTRFDTVKDRVKAYTLHKDIPISQFEMEAGLSNGYVNAMRKGMGDRKIRGVSRAFPDLNIDWLLTGEGEMLVSDIQEEIDEELTPKTAIRYYPEIVATASQIEDMPAPSFDELEYKLIFIEGYGGCQALKATGDSMYPRICNGDIVVFQKWEENYIQSGEIYLIISKRNERMYKYLHELPPSEEGERLFECRSANVDQVRFAPFRISGCPWFKPKLDHSS